MEDKSREILSKYIPYNAITPCLELIRGLEIRLKIVNKRKTKHGDFRRYPDGSLLITVNATLNPYAFLITLIHEIAHLVCYMRYGDDIKSHGKEWKNEFSFLMSHFIDTEIFPQKLIPILQRHFQNPKASTDTDHILSIALKNYDKKDKNTTFVFQLFEGDLFRYANKSFKKGKKRVKRYECKEISTGKTYLFQPHVVIELI